MTNLRASPDSTRSSHVAAAHIPATGELAPDFAEVDDAGRRITLQEFRGSPIILAFSSVHWNPAAPERIEDYNRLISRLRGSAGARLLRVEHEGAWRALAFDDVDEHETRVDQVEAGRGQGILGDVMHLHLEVGRAAAVVFDDPGVDVGAQHATGSPDLRRQPARHRHSA